METSLFREESIKDFMLQYYNIHVTEFQLLNRGRANIFILNPCKYILKEYPSNYEEEKIQRETDVIHHLIKKKFPVPNIIRNIHNRFYTKYYNRIILVEEFIEGDTKENNTGDFHQLIDAASMLGKIVVAMDDLKIELPEIHVEEWFSKEKIEKSIEKYQTLLKKVPDNLYGVQIQKDFKDKIKMLQNLSNKIVLNKLQNLTVKKTHGDYNVLQFIYHNNQIKAIIDFEAVTSMPIVWEIIRSYSYIDIKASSGTFDLKHFKAYVEEFEKYVPLTPQDIQFMPYIYLAQLLHSSYGYKEYIEDNTNISFLEFGFFRTKLCKYLFGNASRICDFLEENRPLKNK